MKAGEEAVRPRQAARPIKEGREAVAYAAAIEWAWG